MWKRNCIISKLKKKYWRTTHKFRLEVPHSVKRAYEINAETGTYLWRKAISKEMLKVKVAYEENEAISKEIRSGEASGFVRFHEITCHFIFNVKMDVSRKCQMVASGATTEMPASLTYSSVVSSS